MVKRQKNKIFAELAETEQNEYFRKWFQNASEGIFEKKFSYENGELSFAKNRKKVFKIRFSPEDHESIDQLKQFISTHAKVLVNDHRENIKITKTQKEQEKSFRSSFKNNQIFRSQLIWNFLEQFHLDDPEQVLDYINALFASETLTYNNFVFDKLKISSIEGIKITPDAVFFTPKKVKDKSSCLFGNYRQWQVGSKPPKHDFDKELKKIFGPTVREQTTSREVPVIATTTTPTREGI